MLAGEVAAGDTTGPFARIHSGELAEQAASTAKVLRESRAPRHEPERLVLLARAEGTRRALERLHSRPDDRDQARRLSRELMRLAG
jgi:hypothetical protein